MVTSVLRPGVQVVEKDLIIGLQAVAAGGIGIPAKFEKGEIGKPIFLTGGDDLQRFCGLPVPGYNLADWHYIDNVFYYTGNVVATRVEVIDSEFDMTDLEITCKANNAQAGVFESGNYNNNNLKDELKTVVSTFSQARARREFEKLARFIDITSGSGANPNLESIDTAIMIKNYVEDVDDQDIYSNENEARDEYSFAITGDDVHTVPMGAIIIHSDLQPDRGSYKEIKSIGKITNVEKFVTIEFNSAAELAKLGLKYSTDTFGVLIGVGSVEANSSIINATTSVTTLLTGTPIYRITPANDGEDFTGVTRELIGTLYEDVQIDGSGTSKFIKVIPASDALSLDGVSSATLSGDYITTNTIDTFDTSLFTYNTATDSFVAAHVELVSRTAETDPIKKTSKIDFFFLGQSTSQQTTFNQSNCGVETATTTNATAVVSLVAGASDVYTLLAAGSSILIDSITASATLITSVVTYLHYDGAVGAFSAGESLKGLTTSAACTIGSVDSSGKILTVTGVTGSFKKNETIKGQTTNAMASLVSVTQTIISSSSFTFKNRMAFYTATSDTTTKGYFFSNSNNISVYWFESNALTSVNVAEVTSATALIDSTEHREMFRFVACTPGKWPNTSNITVSICDMANFDTDFASYFSESPETDSNGEYKLDQIAVLISENGIVMDRIIGSLDPAAKDSQGMTQNIVEILNRKQQYVYLGVNADIFDTDGVYDVSFPTVMNIPIYGGYSGYTISSNGAATLATPSTNDVKTALDVFNDPEDVEIDYLGDGAWAGDVNILTDLVNIAAQLRGDCFVCSGPKPDDIKGFKYPSTVMTSVFNQAPYSTLASGNADSQYVSFYANAKKVYDSINDVYVWISCSSDALGLHASTDRSFDPWYPVAGTRRGVLKNVLQLAWYPGAVEREQLTKSRLNPIFLKKGDGFVIFDTMTLYSKKSDLAENYNRKTVNYIRRQLGRSLGSFNFEIADSTLRYEIVQSITPFLRSIQNRRGLESFSVVCNEKNQNPSEPYTVIVDVYLTLIKAAKQIRLQLNIVPSGVTITGA